MKVVPNIISIFRICLIPVFVLLYFTDTREVKYYAVMIFIIAGVSDFFDGYIARKFEAQSKLGKLLDPLADKLMTFTALICLTITNFSNKIFLVTVIVFFVKEILMGIGGLILHKKARIELPPANFIGKVSTFVFIVVCAALMLFRAHLSNLVIALMISVAMGLTLIALAVYVHNYIKIMKSLSKERQDNIRQDNVRQDNVRQDNVRQDNVRQDNEEKIGEIECNQHSVQDVNETPQ